MPDGSYWRDKQHADANGRRYGTHAAIGYWSTMLAPQRHGEIMSRLASAGGVRVTELAKSLQVAEGTIRRDLEKLEGEGRLVRIHGGAVPVTAERRDLPFDVRKATNLAAKQAIARHAVSHIAEGDVIALDASSTACELARIIPDIPLTVVTSSLPIAMTLLSCTHIQVVSTGGLLDRTTRSFLGSPAEQALERLNINKLFLSAKGVDMQRGLSEVTDDQACFKRNMMDAAEQTFLLLDHSKFGVRSFVFYARPNDVDTVITDAATNPDLVAALAGMDVKTEIAD